MKSTIISNRNYIQSSFFLFIVVSPLISLQVQSANGEVDEKKGTEPTVIERAIGFTGLNGRWDAVKTWSKLAWMNFKPPDSSGFSLEPTQVVLSISRRAYMSRMTECWPKWTLIPDNVKETIWQDFLAEVDLQDADISVVYRHWCSKVAKNYRETVNSLKTAGKKPQWMSAAVWDDFVTWWGNEEFRRQSERNSTNRSKNPVTHRGGFKSFQHHREDLERQRGGASVSYWDVFTHTHALSQVDEAGTVSYSWDHDAKAQSAYQKFQQARTSILEGSGRNELTADEEDAIFESVMDPVAHGRRYGFGNQSAKTAQIEYRRAQDKEEIAQLRAQVAALKERNIRTEAKTEELNRRLTEFMEQYGRFSSSGGSGGE